MNGKPGSATKYQKRKFRKRKVYKTDFAKHEMHKMQFSESLGFRHLLLMFDLMYITKTIQKCGVVSYNLLISRTRMQN